MNDIKKRIAALERGKSGPQVAVVYAKPSDDTLYNADGSVYEGTARLRFVFAWELHEV